MENSTDDGTGESRESNRLMLMGGAILFGLFLLLDAVLWFSERGGVFSLVSALTSIHAKPPVLDIDQNALRFPILIIVWLVLIGLCRLFNVQIDLSTRGKTLLPLLIIIGGGFILDAEFGEPIITHYMASHGYSRCEAGDWAQGNGKSRVWFADYVLQSVECRRRTETVPERTLFK